MAIVKRNESTVARRSSADVIVQVRERIVDLIRRAPVEEEGSGLARMLDRILQAESIETLATMFDKMDNSRTVAGLPLMLESFVVRKSDYNNEADSNRLGIYLTVFATNRQTGDEVTFNVGAQTIVVTLLVAWSREWFPLTGHIETKQLDEGKVASNFVFDA